jgi:hypothetical protein
MSEFKFKTCIEACQTLEESCPNKDCRSWSDFDEDLNCTHSAVQKHGSMTLREISKRVGCSFVRVKQIETEVLEKIKDQITESNYL